MDMVIRQAVMQVHVKNVLSLRFRRKKVRWIFQFVLYNMF